ncbi:hypothetical protein C8T65DRAFT_744748 [Cerioporus squamosus]|nr:hypothetical protein C8T65DRAFT_744748 [Cerioporus squamosus]
MALNLDILAEIILYLPPDCALVYGATCAFLRPLAIRHAVADVVFTSAKHLRMFIDFMLADATRCPYLRRLVILDVLYISSFTSSLSDDVDCLGQLLNRATNLAVLAIPSSEMLFIFKERFLDTVASLESLISLSLTEFTSDCGLLHQLVSAPRLQRLVLSKEITVFPTLTRRSMSLPPMPNLHTLVLKSIYRPPLLSTLPVLAPAIRSLQVADLTFWLEDLSQAERPCHRAPDRWHARPATRLGSGPLFEVLAAASPKRLSMAMLASFNQPLWRTYAPAMPRLQFMELIVIDHDPSSPDLEYWLENMAQVGHSALFALAIYVLRPCQDQRQHPMIPSAGPIDMHLSSRLLAAIKHSLPSLRLLALSIGLQPSFRKGQDIDMYSVFDGPQFNWWTRDDPSGLTTKGPTTRRHAIDGSGHNEKDDRARSWRRVEEKKGSVLFAELRTANLERQTDQEAFISLYT